MSTKYFLAFIVSAGVALSSPSVQTQPSSANVIQTKSRACAQILAGKIPSLMDWGAEVLNGSAFSPTDALLAESVLLLSTLVHDSSIKMSKEIEPLYDGFLIEYRSIQDGKYGKTKNHIDKAMTGLALNTLTHLYHILGKDDLYRKKLSEMCKKEKGALVFLRNK